MAKQNGEMATDAVISIGTVAEKLGISDSTIRMYEAEGLIIPRRTESGHRLFSLEDINRIRKIQQIIQGGVNIEGIRRLQALIPCWELLPCKLRKWNRCPAFKNRDKPCWMQQGLHCVEKGNECRLCRVYRFGSQYMEDIKEIVYRKNSEELNSAIKVLLEDVS